MENATEKRFIRCKNCGFYSSNQSGFPTCRHPGGLLCPEPDDGCTFGLTRHRVTLMRRYNSGRDQESEGGAHCEKAKVGND